LGWIVHDTPTGYDLAVRPPYPVLPSVEALPDWSAEPDTHPLSFAVLVEGWPDDVRRCVGSVLEHTAAPLLALDLANVDGAGDALHELAAAAPGRVTEWHVEESAGWSAARTALLRADTATLHVWLDPSVELTGDITGALADAFAKPEIAVAGPWGVDVRADWLEFDDAPGPGPCDAVLGYLLAVRRSAALAVGGPDPKARFYRNADLEFCFALRAGGGVAVQTPPLPVERHRHRGYHDSDPAYRDAESKKTYNRFLQRFRGREDLRTHR
jgi:hypothetical protein